MTEQYKNMGQAIERLKWPIIWIAVAGTVLQLGLLMASLIMAQSKDEIPFGPLETCQGGMKSIFGNKADPDLVTSEVISDLHTQNFKIEEITLIKLLNPYLCDVVVKDIKGFRSYAVSLEKNLDFPHMYKISDVKGQKIVSEYQVEDSL